VKTARDLRNADPAAAKKILGVTGQRTVLELKGIQCVTDDLVPAPRKTMVSGRSFGRKVTDAKDLMEAVSTHAVSAGERLRKEGLMARGLSVFAETAHFVDKPFGIGASIDLGFPTDSTLDFVKAAKTAMAACFREGPKYARAGIMLHELISVGEAAAAKRADLFRDDSDPGDSDLMAAMDAINRKYGSGTLRVLSQGPPNPTWAMARKRLSPLSTTDWDLIPEVRAGT
jgi:DNA polymerase V